MLVISDIHGEYDKFVQLLEKTNYQSAKDQLILLGDYVDRGPKSKQVLEKVIELQSEGAIVLRGNHDQMMIDVTEEKEGAWERWKRNGGLATLESYHGTKVAKKIPDSEIFHKHINFIKTLDYYYETSDYIFVHAGVKPGKEPEKTDPWTLLWIRDEFFKHYQGEKTVVFGHTPTRYLNGPGDDSIYFGKNKIIGIDGGAVYGGQLNCLELPSKKAYAVE